MRKITPDKLEAGMKLAKPLSNLNGMVILAEGQELSEKWIQRIIDMGFETVQVDGLNTPEIPREQMLLQLEARFRHVENMPHMDSIREALREHIEALYG